MAPKHISAGKILKAPLPSSLGQKHSAERPTTQEVTFNASLERGKERRGGQTTKRRTYWLEIFLRRRREEKSFRNGLWRNKLQADI